MNIIFVCHGNICRSPMAEFVMKELCKEQGLSSRLTITSAGVSSEEEGNDMYPPAKRMLRAKGVPFSRHRAHRITDSEFYDSDLVLVMDWSNRRILERRFGRDGRIRMLLSRDIADPWYTEDFETAYDDILRGCKSLLSEIAGRA